MRCAPDQALDPRPFRLHFANAWNLTGVEVKTPEAAHAVTYASRFTMNASTSQPHPAYLNAVKRLRGKLVMSIGDDGVVEIDEA
jgi:hypothetical protein